MGLIPYVTGLLKSLNMLTDLSTADDECHRFGMSLVEPDVTESDVTVSSASDLTQSTGCASAAVSTIAATCSGTGRNALRLNSTDPLTTDFFFLLSTSKFTIDSSVKAFITVVARTGACSLSTSILQSASTL